MKRSLSQTNNPRRQKLIKGSDSSSKGPTPYLKAIAFLETKETKPAITTLAQLKSCLQTAIELEHSTIPPYLCALYSIADGTNAFATSIIRSVVVEEMLHMILAANILNAIGGEPQINSKKFVPSYPAYLPDSDMAFQIPLGSFSRETIEVFLKIEKPAHPTKTPRPKGYSTIGEFYQSLMLGLEYVNDNTKDGIFIKDEEQKKRQITKEHYYGSGGEVVPVYDIKSARIAIEEIVGQGEGIDDTINGSDEKLFEQADEYAHYFRFNEVLQERMYAENDTPLSGPTGEKADVDWDAVHPMIANPKIAMFKDQPELYAKARSFNQTYTSLLDNIHQACNGNQAVLMQGIGLMYQLKYKAVELMNIPYKDGFMAGPTFEFENKL